MGGVFEGNYWLLEVFLVVFSVLVGIAGTSLYYRFQRQQSPSERETSPSSEGDPAARAHEALRSLVEGYVIEKREITRESLLNLLAAIERRHRVELSGSQTLISVLQDVHLSLEQSKHVDLAQKRRYAGQLHESIAQLQQAEQAEARRRAARSVARRRTTRTRKRRATSEPSTPPAQTAVGDQTESGGEEPSAPPEE